MAANGRKYELLAVGLAGGKSISAAARDAKVAERTARRYAAAPAFRQRIADLRAEMVAEATGRLAAFATMAAGKLAGLLASTDEMIVFRASKAILELQSKLRTEADLQAQLDEVTRQLAEFRQRLGDGSGDNSKAAERLTQQFGSLLSTIDAAKRGNGDVPPGADGTAPGNHRDDSLPLQPGKLALGCEDVNPRLRNGHSGSRAV